MTPPLAIKHILQGPYHSGKCILAHLNKPIIKAPRNGGYKGTNSAQFLLEAGNVRQPVDTDVYRLGLRHGWHLTCRLFSLFDKLCSAYGDLKVPIMFEVWSVRTRVFILVSVREVAPQTQDKKENV